MPNYTPLHPSVRQVFPLFPPAELPRVTAPTSCSACRFFLPRLHREGEEQPGRKMAVVDVAENGNGGAPRPR